MSTTTVAVLVPELASMPVADLEMIDAIRSLAEGGEDENAFLAELVETYLQELPGILKSFAAVAAEGDAAKMVLVAHHFKGSSNSLGLMRVGAIAARLEADGRDGQKGNFLPLVALLTAHVSDAGIALKALAKGAPAKVV